MASSIRVASVALAAGATTANVLAGNRFEFLPRTGHVAIYAITHLTGDVTAAATLGELVTSTVSFGNVVLIDTGVVQPSDHGLSRNEHLFVSGIGQGGDRLIISLVNGTIVIVDTVFLIEITDL